MIINIRKATNKDFEKIFLLLQEFAAFQKTPERFTITLAQIKKDEALFHWFIAEDENKNIVGLASCFFAYYSWIGKSLYLDDLFVIESMRGKNIGTQLLQTVIQFAKENDCKKLIWQVSNLNHNAIAFYKKIGAIIDDVEINCDFLL